MLFPSKLHRLSVREGSTPPKGHIAALDGIRGLAILLVTLYRFAGGGQSQDLPEGFLWDILSHGNRGVDLFFVLSGFLITGILYDSKPDPHFFRNFYARRSLRIFPLYYAVLVLTLVVAPLVSATAAAVFAPARINQAWLWFYGTNLLQAGTGNWPFGCLNHFWSLAVEEHFYFFWPLMIFWLSRRAAIGACLALIVASFGSRIAFVALGGNTVAPEVFTFFRADALVIGGLVALLARGPGGIMRLSTVARIGLCVLGPATLLLSIGHRRLLTIPDTCFAALFACMLVAGLTTRADSPVAQLWSSRCLRFFGKFSYAIYVFQYPLIPILAPVLSVEILGRAIGSESIGRVIYIVLMTAITVVCAVASWHILEKRFLSLKKYFEISA